MMVLTYDGFFFLPSVGMASIVLVTVQLETQKNGIYFIWVDGPFNGRQHNTIQQGKMF